MYKIHYKAKNLNDDKPISISYRGSNFMIIIGSKVYSIRGNFEPDNLDISNILDAIKKMTFDKNSIHIKIRMNEEFHIFYQLVRLAHIIYLAVETLNPKLKVNILIYGCGEEKGITPRSFSIKFRAVDGHPKTRVGKSDETLAAIRQKRRQRKK